MFEAYCPKQHWFEARLQKLTAIKKIIFANNKLAIVVTRNEFHWSLGAGFYRLPLLTRCIMLKQKELRFQELAMLSVNPLLRNIHQWWLQRAERHFLICADVEEKRAREAQQNVAYYQKRAAMARSARL